MTKSHNRDGYDPLYARHLYERARRWGGHKLLFDNLTVFGIENIKTGNPDVTRLYISNHMSHADYLTQSYVFLQQGVEMPMIVAGSNLNLGILKAIGMDLGRAGAFFLNRQKFSTSEGFSYGREVHEKIKKLVQDDRDFLVYPNGGRSYSCRLFERFKTGIIKAILNSCNHSSQRDIDIVPVAIGYDKIIEKKYFPALMHHKSQQNNIRYIATDAVAFLRQLVRARFTSSSAGNAYINFGFPVSVEDITSSASLENKVEAVRDFSMSRIRELYCEIEGVRKK